MSDDKPTPATPLLGSKWKHRMPPHELASIIAIDAQGIHLSAWLPVAEVQIAGGGTLQTGGRLYHLLASSVEMLEMEWERATDDGREAALCPYCRTPLVWGDSARRGELANVVCPSEAVPVEFDTEQRPLRATHVARIEGCAFCGCGTTGYFNSEPSRGGCMTAGCPGNPETNSTEDPQLIKAIHAAVVAEACRWRGIDKPRTDGEYTRISDVWRYVNVVLAEVRKFDAAKAKGR